MVKIDLITGFLGSGKTTFIKKYATYLMRKGLNIGILENDHGAVNVDMMLLQELRGDQCELEMISGGCDAETHRRRFRTKLISMGMCGYDRVLVEPSGIYDIDEFFDVLRDEPLDRWYEIGNVIAVVNAGLEESLSDQAEFLLASEVADAGSIVLSRSQEVPVTKQDATIEHLNRSLVKFGCRRQIKGDEVLRSPWNEWTEREFERVLNGGYCTESYRKPEYRENQGFQSLYYMNLQIKKEELKEKIKEACVGIAKNPIILGILAGLVVGLSGIEFPTIINKTVNSVAQMATPLALITIGAGFEGRKALAKIKPTIAASMIKLVIQPLIFLPVAAWMGFSGEKMIAILIMLASPTTPSCYIMAKSMNNDGVLTASVIVTTTLLAAFTLTGWIFILKSVGLIG